MNDVIDAVADALRERLLGGTIRTVIAGHIPEQAEMAKSSLPLLAVDGNSTSRRRGGTAKDIEEHRLRILLAVDARVVRNDQRAPKDAWKRQASHVIRDIVEGREVVDGCRQVRRDTLFGILDEQITLDGLVLYTDEYEANYGEVYAADGKSVIAHAALITLVARDRSTRRRKP